MAITPNKDQFIQLAEDAERQTGEVVMLNLLEYRERATDAEGAHQHREGGLERSVLLAMTPAPGFEALPDAATDHRSN